MAKVLFPLSSAPGTKPAESGGRLINAYAEPLPEGSPSDRVHRRAPGTDLFCGTSLSGFRGMWYDGDSYVYAAWGDSLYYIDSNGTETLISELLSSSITFLTSAVDTTNTTAYTYSAVAIGVAHAARHIVVAVFFDATNDYPPASVTVGGVSASLVKAQSDFIALYIAAVPTGTTADIVVTYASAAINSAIGVWRLDGLASATAHHTGGDADTGGGTVQNSYTLNVPSNGVAIAAVKTVSGISNPWDTGTDLITKDFTTAAIESSGELSGASGESGTAQTIAIGAYGVTSVYSVAASWTGGALGNSLTGNGVVTFAKNNAVPPDQVLCTPSVGAYSFTTSSITLLDVDGEVGNSVCFGEGYFFVTIPDGRVFASAVNDVTFAGTDYIRCEARAEANVRGIFYDGELYVFGLTHCEVWGSGGNPNATGFPLNRTTVIWRGLIAPLAICGFEEGFHPGLIFVSDDNSVWQLQGYTPIQISPPWVDRLIEACANKTSIRTFVYHIGGNPCVVIDIAQEATVVYDIGNGFWHERKSDGIDYWSLTGNSVKAFGKWIAGSHLTGNLYEITDAAFDEDGDTLEFIVESIAMEAFPQRVRIDRVDFNFVAGQGDATTPDPKCKIQWSDDGGNTWSLPVERKLGEAGKYIQQVRINGLGLTGPKGRRWRISVSDPVYVGLLGGDMAVSGRPS